MTLDFDKDPYTRQQGIEDGRHYERFIIVRWLRNFDLEDGEVNRFLPTELADLIEKRIHDL